MKIAIIGSGISGLTVAYRLHQLHSITLFEAADRIGGHTHTVDVHTDENCYSIDTGFIVFNNRTYPGFIQLIGELGVEYQDAQMSFSVRNDRQRLEYRGADLNGLFAQRKNLLRPGFYRLLSDLLRFNKVAAAFSAHSAGEPDECTVQQFFDRFRFGQSFIQNYFLPMGAAIWSCPTDTFLNFPVRFVIEFYANHGLLSVNNRPQWHVICGGSNQYLEPLSRSFKKRIRLNCPVSGIDRTADGVWVSTKNGDEIFDHVVFACHSDQALRILGPAATRLEQKVLSAFPYERNKVTLHTDESILPKNRRAWACWNYLVDPEEPTKATATYHMNQLQSIRSSTNFLVSLNSNHRINSQRILREFCYSHPIFTAERAQMQQRHRDLIGPNRTSFCGAYWGNGFHEDGVQSANRVVELLRNENRPVDRADAADVVTTGVAR